MPDIDKMTEQVARLMCKAETPPVDPDKTEYSMVPVFSGQEKYASRAEFWPIREWHRRVDVARAVIDFLRQDTK